MPAVTAASSNRTRLTVQSEGAYPAGYGVAPAVAVSNGIATNVNEVQITGETLKFDLKTTRSKILRQDRGVSDLIPTSAGVNGVLTWSTSTATRTSSSVPRCRVTG